jgi:hypothetical protein
LQATLRQSNEPEIQKTITLRAAAATHRSGFFPLESGNRPAGLNDRWMVLGVCILLAAITWLVFGQTLRHQFINLDDGPYVFKNPQVVRG